MRVERKRLFGFSLLLAITLSGCASPRVAEDDTMPDNQQVVEPSEPAEESQPQGIDGTISAALYQPTHHGILALQGGVGTAGNAEPAVTRWKRGVTGQEFTLRLDPDEVTVQPLEPGRYVLVAADAGGRSYSEFADGSGASRIPTIVIDPGEVVYGGQVFIREATVKLKPAKKDAKKKGKPQPTSKQVVMIDVKDREAAAREAVRLQFPQQADSMKKRFLAAR